MGVPSGPDGLFHAACSCDNSAAFMLYPVDFDFFSVTARAQPVMRSAAYGPLWDGGSVVPQSSTLFCPSAEEVAFPSCSGGSLLQWLDSVATRSTVQPTRKHNNQ
jgi:hypothetical protein